MKNHPGLEKVQSHIAGKSGCRLYLLLLSPYLHMHPLFYSGGGRLIVATRAAGQQQWLFDSPSIGTLAPKHT